MIRTVSYSAQMALSLLELQSDIALRAAERALDDFNAGRCTFSQALIRQHLSLEITTRALREGGSDPREQRRILEQLVATWRATADLATAAAASTTSTCAVCGQPV